MSKIFCSLYINRPCQKPWFGLFVHDLYLEVRSTCSLHIYCLAKALVWTIVLGYVSLDIMHSFPKALVFCP